MQRHLHTPPLLPLLAQTQVSQKSEIMFAAACLTPEAHRYLVLLFCLSQNVVKSVKECIEHTQGKVSNPWKGVCEAGRKPANGIGSHGKDPPFLLCLTEQAVKRCCWALIFSKEWKRLLHVQSR